MKHKFLEICEKSVEQQDETKTLSDEAEPTDATVTNTKTAKTPALDQYTINLTEKAKKAV